MAPKTDSMFDEYFARQKSTEEKPTSRRESVKEGPIILQEVDPEEVQELQIESPGSARASFKSI